MHPSGSMCLPQFICCDRAVCPSIGKCVWLFLLLHCGHAANDFFISSELTLSNGWASSPVLGPLNSGEVRSSGSLLTGSPSTSLVLQTKPAEDENKKFIGWFVSPWDGTDLACQNETLPLAFLHASRPIPTKPSRNHDPQTLFLVFCNFSFLFTNACERFSLAGMCTSGHVAEQMLLEVASQAGSSPYLHGMRYFALDNCWMKPQQLPASELGTKHEITDKDTIFINGVSSLARFVQDQGLLFGLGITVSQEKCTEFKSPPGM